MLPGGQISMPLGQNSSMRSSFKSSQNQPIIPNVSMSALTSALSGITEGNEDDESSSSSSSSGESSDEVEEATRKTHSGANMNRDNSVVPLPSLPRTLSRRQQSGVNSFSTEASAIDVLAAIVVV